MNIVAIVQARTSSNRLPGKVLLDIMGKPMLERQIERLGRAETISKLVLATSDQQDDNALETLCKNIGLACFRGKLDDVLDRFYQCAAQYSPDHVVRLTGDCPLADPTIIDQTIRYHLDGDYDYTSNVLTPTWPDGMDVEVMRLQCLSDAFNEARLPSEREHVTSFIYSNPNRYRLGSVTQKQNLSALRLTVDEMQDFELIKKIYEHLYPTNPEFLLGDVLDLINRKPELQTLNQQFTRNEGMLRSLQKDSVYLDSKK
jgi:spore coat polysaccharide biosynthesis protein SpsF